MSIELRGSKSKLRFSGNPTCMAVNISFPVLILGGIEEKEIWLSSVVLEKGEEEDILEERDRCELGEGIKARMEKEARCLSFLESKKVFFVRRGRKPSIRLFSPGRFIIEIAEQRHKKDTHTATRSGIFENLRILGLSLQTKER